MCVDTLSCCARVCVRVCVCSRCVRTDSVLAAHRERRRKDKNAIMTMVFKEAPPTHRSR
jgi:hypothetical protein